MAIQSGTIEVISPGLIQGATDFGEFEEGFGIPDGLSVAVDTRGSPVMTFAIEDDPVEGRYFRQSYTPLNDGFTHPELTVARIDAFDGVKDQVSTDSIEMLARVFLPGDVHPGDGNIRPFGPTWRIKTTPEEGVADMALTDAAHLMVTRLKRDDGGDHYDLEAGTHPPIQVAGPLSPGIGLDFNTWVWIRTRWVRGDLGIGSMVLRIRVWVGALSDEPSAWTFEDETFTDTDAYDTLGDLGFTNRFRAWSGARISFLSFTTVPDPGPGGGGATEIEEVLDANPPPGPDDITLLQGIWAIVEAEETDWGSCLGEETALIQTASGLVVRDQFDRADSQALGNSWEDWEGAATDVQIISGQVVCAAVSSKTGGFRPVGEVASDVDTIAQINCRVAFGNLGGIRVRSGPSNTEGYNFRMDTRSGGQWAITENGGLVASSSTNPPSPDEWRGLRAVIEGSILRFYSTPVLADREDVSQDPVLRLSIDRGGSVIEDANRTGFEHDQISTVIEFDEFFVCGREVTVSGLSPGWKVQIDARAPVVESGGEVQINVEGWALPLGTIAVLDASDVEQFSVTPTGGVWGGDVYEVGLQDIEVDTQWVECDAV